MRNWNRIVAAVALASFLPLVTVGCFGSFQAVRKVYSFNDEVNEDKWVKEGVFLLLNIPFVPIYSLAAAFDALFVNSVEFWTGENPLAASTSTGSGANGEIAIATRNPDGTIDLKIVEADGTEHNLTLVRDGDRLSALTSDGALIGQVRRDGNGAVLADPIN